MAVNKVPFVLLGLVLSLGNYTEERPYLNYFYLLLFICQQQLLVTGKAMLNADAARGANGTGVSTYPVNDFRRSQIY